MNKDADLERLAELARAATPGPWTASEDAGCPSVGDVLRFVQPQALIAFGVPMADAAYIAAASPDVIGPLVEKVKQAKRYEEALERVADSRNGFFTAGDGGRSWDAGYAEKIARDALGAP